MTPVFPSNNSNTIYIIKRLLFVSLFQRSKDIDYGTYGMYTIYMPDIKVYLRADDVDKWNAIEKKAEWLHNALTDFSTIIGDPTPKAKQNQILPPIIKTPDDAKRAVEKIKPTTYVPKTNWGA